MQTTRVTRSSVLGKRGHHQESTTLSTASSSCTQLQTPESTPNPKRARTTSTVLDGDANKENVPPMDTDAINSNSSPTSSRPTRGLRRTATEIVTPTRSRIVSSRRASASTIIPATPTSELRELEISTPPPTPPHSLLPIHAKVRALLRSTCNGINAQLAGRDAERQTILDFLLSFADESSMNDDITSLYISGSPGTGKTALVNSIIRTFGRSDVKFISVNCMALKSTDALWERLVEELGISTQKTSTKTKKVKGREAVEAALRKLNTKCVMILDELDHITPNSQSLATLFSLLENAPSTLRLIGIANTHTLTSSSTSATFSSLPNTRTLHFAPYSPAQLLDIVQSRLSSLFESNKVKDGSVNEDAKKLLPTPALTLLTKKVAALTGDVRCLFEVLRRAIDFAVTASLSTGAEGNPFGKSLATVTPAHILAALKAYSPSSSKPMACASSTSAPSVGSSNSEIVTKIRNLGLQQRAVILSILLASKRLQAGQSLSMSASISASPKKTPASPVKRSASSPNVNPSRPGVGIDTAQLYSYYNTILTRSEAEVIDPVSKSEFFDLLGMLEGIGLVTLSSSLFSSLSGGTGKGRRPFGRSASFGSALGKSAASSVGEVRLAEGVWADEVLRGLGVIGSTDGKVDVIEEEMRAIWAREKARLGRDVKAFATASKRPLDAFADAFEG